MIVFFLDHLSPSCRGLARTRSGVILGTALHAPVEDIIILISLADKEISEKLAEIGIVGLIIEAEGTSVVKEDPELVGESAAQEIGRGGHLFLHDAIILLLFGSSLETLPRECPTEEVHQNVGQRLKIVTASLLDAQVSIDRRITSSSSEVLVFSVRDVEVCLWVSELLGKPEVNDIDLIATLTDSHQEVVRLDVTVDEVAGVDVLDARDLATCQR